MHNTRQGFTLIELMVSIALMLLLIGIVMSIFNNSSTTVTMAEAKVEIFQNARTTFEAMAQEITDATEICIYNATTEEDLSTMYDNNHANIVLEEKIVRAGIENPRPSLTLKTITHWVQEDVNTSGEALVQYTIEPHHNFNGEMLFSLRKTIFDKKDSSIKIYDGIITSDILSEYLVCPVNSNDHSITQPEKNFPIYIERLKANSPNSWSWDGEDYQTRLARISLDSKYKWSNRDSEIKDYINNSLPVAIRITMTFTDEFLRAKRTVSRVFWIPKGN